jgi:hypothetical protein
LPPPSPPPAPSFGSGDTGASAPTGDPQSGAAPGQSGSEGAAAGASDPGASNVGQPGAAASGPDASAGGADAGASPGSESSSGAAQEGGAASPSGAVQESGGETSSSGQVSSSGGTNDPTQSAGSPGADPASAQNTDLSKQPEVIINKEFAGLDPKQETGDETGQESDSQILSDTSSFTPSEMQEMVDAIDKIKKQEPLTERQDELLDRLESEIKSEDRSADDYDTISDRQNTGAKDIEDGQGDYEDVSPLYKWAVELENAAKTYISAAKVALEGVAQFGPEPAKKVGKVGEDAIGTTEDLVSDKSAAEIAVNTQGRACGYLPDGPAKTACKEGVEIERDVLTKMKIDKLRKEDPERAQKEFEEWAERRVKREAQKAVCKDMEGMIKDGKKICNYGFYFGKEAGKVKESFEERAQDLKWEQDQNKRTENFRRQDAERIENLRRRAEFNRIKRDYLRRQKSQSDGEAESKGEPGSQRIRLN